MLVVCRHMSVHQDILRHPFGPTHAVALVRNGPRDWLWVDEENALGSSTVYSQGVGLVGSGFSVSTFASPISISASRNRLAWRQ